jgi:putative Holliday junction resolvase
MPITHESVLALDVGQARVGVAQASMAARLPSALLTLRRDEHFFDRLKQLVEQEGAGALVVGLPRGLDGQSTAQTVAISQFVKELKQHIALPVHLQDEAVTSRQAEAELQSRRRSYVKGDIDALAAVYILQDWLDGQDQAEASDV